MRIKARFERWCHVMYHMYLCLFKDHSDIHLEYTEGIEIQFCGIPIWFIAH